MIAIEARGRLGNHMFQFAFGLAAAKRLETDFAIDDWMLHERFTLAGRHRPLARLRRSASFRLRSRVAPFRRVAFEGDEDPAEVLAMLEDHTRYAGFFQSESFFQNARTEVSAAFTARAHHRRTFLERYGDLIRKPYVCCHVRTTDYREWHGGLALPSSYYRDCLERAGVDADTPVVFVGDDLEEVEVAFADESYRFERNDEIIDLLLLVHAETVVTSNSSFAWWGAWLGTRPDRRVFAPRWWIGLRHGREVPKGVIPPQWIQVSVELPP